MNCIDPSDIIAIIALLVSLYVGAKGWRLSKLQNQPDCRIKVTSIEQGKGFEIRLENVGTGIMVIDKVKYIYNPNREKISSSSAKEDGKPGNILKKITDFLSKLFSDNSEEETNESDSKDDDVFLSKYFCKRCKTSKNGINCVTRSEANVEKNHLFPDSRHHLYRATFSNQDDLKRAWEFVKDLDIQVTYHAVYRRFPRKKYVSEFGKEYDAFCAALKCGKKGERTLRAFQSSQEITDRNPSNATTA